VPISGIVIRLTPGLDARGGSAQLASTPHLELGSARDSNIAAVIDAPDYPSHDAALRQIQSAAPVCAVDIVFHDFSDVTDFDFAPSKTAR
jgi:hypothetical protein